MGYNIDYLLRYVSMDTYNKIINSNNDYVLGLLSDNYIDVNLNIKYLIKYGVSNIDKIVYNNINDYRFTLGKNNYIQGYVQGNEIMLDCKN